MMLTVLLLIVFFACFACLYTEGTWGNAVRLINVVTAALLATNFAEPVADYFDDMFPSFTYVCDFLALWGLFGFFMLVLRLGTDFLSRVKVRFLKVADRIGSCFFAAWVGWMMVCFTAMSLHMSPLARVAMFDSFRPEEKMFFELAPDRKWLAFVQKASRGAFARGATEQELRDEKYLFDPQGEFMPKYATRRAKLESQLTVTGSLRVK